MYVTPFLFNILCLSFVGRAFVCMSRPPPSLTGQLCLSLVGRAVVCSSLLPNRGLVFVSCRQSVCVYVTPSLTGDLRSSFVSGAVVCMSPPS